MKWIILFLLISTSAFAQQQQSPTERAFGEKLLKEVQEGLNCSVSNIKLQLEVDTLKIKIRELEEKDKQK